MRLRLLLVLVCCSVGPACGGKTGDVADSVSDAAGDGINAICAQPFPCEPAGFDDASDPCTAIASGLRDYGCERVPPASAGCTYRDRSCANCIEWCCPSGGGDAATIDSGPPAPFDAGPPPPAPPGCVRSEGDDESCLAQQKPGLAFHCSTATSAANCWNNPYAGGGCASTETAYSNLCCASR